jgi:hypothetical protein
MPLIRRGSAVHTQKRGRGAPAQVDYTYGDPRLEAVRAAAETGQWPLIHTQLTAAADDEELTWLVEGAMVVGGAELWLPDAVAAEPHSALPLLVRGARHVEWAWEARTRLRAKFVTKEQFTVFRARLRTAEEMLYEVAEREPDWVAPWYFLQIAGRGLEVGPEVAARRFEATVHRSPGHLAAHRQHLQQLCRKWSGSHEQMHAFARESMLAAPEGSPLGELVAIAHLEQWMDTPEGANTAYITSSEVVLQLYEAAERSVHHPRYVRRRDWTRAFNTFAFVFALAGEHEAAAALFRVLDGAVTEFPWMYVDGRDPTVPVETWRSRVKA